MYTELLTLSMICHLYRWDIIGDDLLESAWLQQMDICMENIFEHYVWLVWLKASNNMQHIAWAFNF